MRRAASLLGDAVRRTLVQQNSGAVRQIPRRCFADDAAAGELKKTMLYDYHVENGGKMVPFAGWSMPIQYKDSIMDSTTNCRSNGSLFDVSHMCGLSLKGPDAIDFLETLVVADIKGLAPGTGTLSVFTNENGGVIDDTVITKVPHSCLNAMSALIGVINFRLVTIFTESLMRNSVLGIIGQLHYSFAEVTLCFPF